MKGTNTAAKPQFNKERLLKILKKLGFELKNDRYEANTQWGIVWVELIEERDHWVINSYPI